MSRYLRQLARETSSKLGPPSHLRLAPRAAAAFEEIHEERLVGPAPPIRESARTAAPAALERTSSAARSVENFIPPITPPRTTSPAAPSQPPSPEDRRIQVARERQADTAPLFTPKPAPPKPASPVAERRAPSGPLEQPLMHPAAAKIESRPPAAKTESHPAAAKTESRPPVAPQPGREVHREVFETTVLSEHFLDTGLPSTNEPRKITEFAIPEPVRTWLRLPPEKPASSPIRAQPPVPVPQPAAPRISPPAAIDVTIGKIEVTIENEPQPPLRVARRAEPRATVPPRLVSPAIGRLARQYLDR